MGETLEGLYLGQRDSRELAPMLARERGDRPAEAAVMWNLLLYYLAARKLKAALQYGVQALQIAREQGLREQTAYVLTDLVKVYFQMNRASQALAGIDEARAARRRLGRCL